MPQNFIAVDRDQAFLMPPSLRDWVAEDHLVWTVLAAVAEMDLSALYAAYRADGHGRPAYEPSLMVALLMYAYSQGNRSSRGIERKCREDVAYRVIAANLVPDHSTIAEFRARHETALAGLFSEVLGLCRAAGMVMFGRSRLMARRCTRTRRIWLTATTGRSRWRSSKRLTGSIVRRTNCMAISGAMSCPSICAHPRVAAAALKEAKRRLERERAADREQQQGPIADPDPGDGSEELVGAGSLDLDPEVIVARVQGRQGWLREARRQLDTRRVQDPRPVPRSRADRLLLGEHKLREDLAVEDEANEAYEAWRARGIALDGTRRMAPGTTKSYVPPPEPAGKVNTTDPDSKNLKAFRGYVQGYNAQAVVTAQQIVIAAEVNVDPQDFSHLGPMVTAAQAELERAGVNDRVGAVVADAGYWHFQQMDELAAKGTRS